MTTKGASLVCVYPLARRYSILQLAFADDKCSVNHDESKPFGILRRLFEGGFVDL
jgi:hypothetical protein